MQNWEFHISNTCSHRSSAPSFSRKNGGHDQVSLKRDMCKQFDGDVVLDALSVLELNSSAIVFPLVQRLPLTSELCLGGLSTETRHHAIGFCNRRIFACALG